MQSLRVSVNYPMLVNIHNESYVGELLLNVIGTRDKTTRDSSILKWGCLEHNGRCTCLPGVWIPLIITYLGLGNTSSCSLYFTCHPPANYFATSVCVGTCVGVCKTDEACESIKQSWSIMVIPGRFNSPHLSSLSSTQTQFLTVPFEPIIIITITWSCWPSRMLPPLSPGYIDWLHSQTDWFLPSSYNHWPIKSLLPQNLPFTFNVTFQRLQKKATKSSGSNHFHRISVHKI